MSDMPNIAFMNVEILVKKVVSNNKLHSTTYDNNLISILNLISICLNVQNVLYSSRCFNNDVRKIFKIRCLQDVLECEAYYTHIAFTYICVIVVCIKFRIKYIY